MVQSILSIHHLPSSKEYVPLYRRDSQRSVRKHKTYRYLISQILHVGSNIVLVRNGYLDVLNIGYSSQDAK